MGNRVIKVSMVLIFMMFVTGLFNFCFAYTATNVTQYDISINEESYTLSVGELENLESLKVTSDNIDSTYYELYSKYGYCYFIAGSELRCFIPIAECNGFYTRSSSSYNLYCGNVAENTVLNYGENNVVGYSFKYNSSTSTWSLTTSSTIAGVSLNYTIIDCSVPIYVFSDNTNTSYIELVNLNIPSTEELITNFDFDVKLTFEPGTFDVPNSSKYVFRNGFDCLVQHNLSNWSDYLVTLDIELSSYTGIWINKFVFDYYDSSHELKYNNQEISEKINLNVLENEYYSIKSVSNTSDNVILTYNIYSKYTNEFLYKRVIKFCFDKGKWWDIFSKSTGNIISDEIYSSDGSIVNNESNDLSSNGTILNKPINNYDFDDLYSLDKDTLQTNVSDLITDSANFFDLFSLFLVMLPGWISSLLYLFFFGIIVITLLRFVRGA